MLKSLLEILSMIRLPKLAGAGRAEAEIVGRATRHIEAAEEVNIISRNSYVQFFVDLQILEIGFDQRMKLLHLRDKEMFALDGAVDDLVEGRGGG